MLNTLRRGVRSWPAKLLLGLLVASFAIWGIGDIFSYRMGDAVAEVGETEVSAERYTDALRRQQSRLSQRAGELVGFETMQQLGIPQQVLAGMIRDAALREELSNIGIAAPDEAVADAIRNDPTFQGPGGQFSDQAYRGLLAQQGMSPAEFEALTRDLLAQEVLTESVAGAVPELPGAAVRLAAYRGETRDVAQIVLPLSLADAPETPDEEALRAFYEEHPERYTEPERRWGRYLHVGISELAEQAEPTEEVLRAAYQARKDQFGEPPTRTLERIPFPNADAAEEAMARIKAGEADFLTIAEERGISEADRALGTVTPRDLPEVTAGPVFERTEPGVIGPVPTPVGSAIFRITEASQGGTPPFEEIREQLATRLATEAALERAPEIANRVEEARAAGKSLEDIAAEVGLPLEGFEGLARNGTLAGGGRATEFEASEVFTEEVFDALDHEERDIIQTPQGGYLLVMVDRIEEQHLNPFEDVADKVRADWRRQARLDALERRAEDLAARLADGAQMQEIATELGEPVSRFEKIDRFHDGPNLPSPLVEDLFAVPEGGTAVTPAADGAGVILAQVTGVTPLEADALASAAADIREVLKRSVIADTRDYYGRALQDRYGATVNDAVLNDVVRLLSGGREG